MTDECCRAVFLDRDGTINEEVGYLCEVDRLRFIPGVVRALTTLSQAGFKLIVVTNQAGVAKGYYSESAVQVMHAEIAKRLARQGAYIDAFYYCPHHPAATVEQYQLRCGCRKPMPGMILSAAEAYGIDLSQSYMIGDKLSDIEAGRQAGCNTILVRTGYGLITEPTLLQEGSSPICVVADLDAASQWILHRTK